MTKKPLYAFTFVWAALIVIPVAGLAVCSLMTMQDYQLYQSFSLDSFNQILTSGRYVVVFHTIEIAAIVTLIEFVIAMPFAIWLSREVRSSFIKASTLALLTIPFFTSLTSRTIVWRALLGETGIVNTSLIDLHIVHAPVEWLLFSPFAVYLGLLAPYFPTMVLPIFLAVSLIDEEILEACRDLGAPSRSVFLDVILPLSAPGILTGILFTFIPILGDTVIGELLGGGEVPMLGSSFGSLLRAMNYPVASALSIVILAMLAIGFVITRLVFPGIGSMSTIFESLRR